MRTNYKFAIQYDGTRYKGWEHQPGTDMTIQGKIENVLSRLVYGEDWAWDDPKTVAAQPPVEVLGCGRTDAGVHAREMIANARIETPVGADGKPMTPGNIRNYCNHYLPDDICISDVRVASDRFHARYNATGKTYRYSCYIGDGKPVFNRKLVYSVDDELLVRAVKAMKAGQADGAVCAAGDGSACAVNNNAVCAADILDIAAMKKAAEYLTGTHDFASFCSNPRMKKSTVRLVDEITITREGAYLHLTYHGTGFLQHMVRILTGTLLEVGLGLRSAESIPALIEAKDRKLAGFTAPAQGLCLMKVDY